MAKLSRIAAIVPVIGATVAASALAGAAVYTVAQTDCDGGQYIRSGHQVELIGSCVNRGELPSGVHPAPRESHKTNKRG
ncbi:hypothetical protein [Sciscionella marina]|uniref:hypothetical protein n=1 Tax=Sciscionella marina TaxID=508770 RepID=UPI00037D4466|nr:hypothetical protein [Sciscionella marina]